MRRMSSKWSDHDANGRRREMASLSSSSSSFSSAFLFVLFLVMVSSVSSFSSSPMRLANSSQQHQRQSTSSFLGTRFVKLSPTKQCKPRGNMKSELNMFMGSDGGILGVGGPELFTILLVGYFVLGPSDLYKLTKEIGVFVQNFRTFTTEATASFENSMESQLQLEDIRKAQRELNEAFSFRRSINVDEEMDAFEVNAASPRPDDMATIASTKASTTAAADSDAAPAKKKKKKIRRRRKRQVVEEEPFELSEVSTSTVPIENNIPDLDMTAAFEDLPASKDKKTTLTKEDVSDDEKGEDTDASLQAGEDKMMAELEAASAELRKEEEEEELRKARRERLKTAAAKGEEMSNEQQAAVQSRFQAQLSGSWNDQILATDESKLEPLADIMRQLAILEEEKNAADKRLQEEFELREKNEEKYYREKRRLLEEAAAKVQTDVYTPTAESKK